MGAGRPRAKGAEINKPKYSGDSGAESVTTPGDKTAGLGRVGKGARAVPTI